MKTPRLRIFAGPNGSGKSTLKSVINDELLGVYINPDEIEQYIKDNGFLDISRFKVTALKDEILDFFIKHPLVKKANLDLEAQKLSFDEYKLDFSNITINSYFASVCADFIRQKLIELKVSFTFETVMSSSDKVELLKKAQEKGYRTYLYFIATQDPIINISRVKNRVRNGGHDVPEEKIISRYYRSMELLSEAIKYSNRAYIFDNSTLDRVWLAQINDGVEIEFKSEDIPTWMRYYLIDKLDIRRK